MVHSQSHITFFIYFLKMLCLLERVHQLISSFSYRQLQEQSLQVCFPSIHFTHEVGPILNFGFYPKFFLRSLLIILMVFLSDSNVICLVTFCNGTYDVRLLSYMSSYIITDVDLQIPAKNSV